MTYLVDVLGVSRPIAVSGSRDERIGAIAARQRGRLSRSQLLVAGVPDRTICGLVAAGQLTREHRGVYAVGHTAPVPLTAETAALVACGEHAVLSHHTAALIHRLIPHGDGRIHVTIGGRHGPNPTGITVHRTNQLNRSEVKTVEGLPVTTPSRTLFDLATTADIASTERAVEEALTQRMVSERQLQALAATIRGDRGGTVVTAILDA